MGRKLLKTVQTITTFRNSLADPVGTRRGPHLVRGPQFENRCCNSSQSTMKQYGQWNEKLQYYTAFTVTLSNPHTAITFCCV